MENLNSILTNVDNNLDQILNIATIVLACLVLAARSSIVIFSQGVELFPRHCDTHGRACAGAGCG